MMFGLRIEVHCVKAFSISREMSKKRRFIWFDMFEISHQCHHNSAPKISNYTNEDDINGDF